MLIVLAILVMLVALVVPRFLGASKKADKQTTLTQVELLRGALERYAVDNKDFPTTEQGLAALMAPPAGGEDTAMSANWSGPYLNKDQLPKDAWGNEFQYVYPGERGRPDLPDIWSLGPDREDNTEDDICSWSSSSSETGDEMGLDGGQDMDIDIDSELPPMDLPTADLP
jgi:general secretion pathway protein G